jgi:hypothetical protein
MNRALGLTTIEGHEGAPFASGKYSLAPLICSRQWRVVWQAKSVDRSINLPFPPHPYTFSSRLSSFKKRQSVPSAMILCGLALIKPASRKPRA